MVNEKFSEQFLRDDNRVPVVKCARQLLHGGRVANGRKRKTLLFRRVSPLLSHLLDSLSVPRHGKSSSELPFSDDLKSDSRKQSGECSVSRTVKHQ
jgi:hypothetical protein